MSLIGFIDRLPKVELHLHLEGAVSTETFADLAAENGIILPGGKTPDELYDYGNLPDFLVIYDLVCASVRKALDFARITFEALERCALSGARYVELFFSPHAHLAHGVRYATMLEGILGGMERARAQYGIFCRLIPAHSRELGPEQGEHFLDMVLAERIPEVIGIGLDYNEAPFPPAPYARMYERAATAGLNLTAHAGESGPASNIRDSLDLLHVSRIDHGYHVVDEPDLVERCLDLGTPFTCCPSTSIATSPWRDLAAPDHAIRRMIEAGLNVSIHSDDPPMFRTDLAREYRLVAENFGLSPQTLKTLALSGLASSWLDTATKTTWLSEWSAEIDLLIQAELTALPV